MVGFEPRDKKQFERLPFTSSIAFFSPPPPFARVSRPHWFFSTRGLLQRGNALREKRARVWRAASPTGSLSLKFVYCVPRVWLRFVAGTRAPAGSCQLSLSIFNARLVAGFDFQRGRVREHEYIEISKVLKVVQIFWFEIVGDSPRTFEKSTIQK